MDRSTDVQAELREIVGAWRGVGLSVAGGFVTLGPRDWHRDPVGGHRWSRACSWDVDLWGGADPRALWRLHRLRHLQVLAWAGACGDTEAAELCRSELRDWLAANPPMRGIGWASGIEVACRAISLVWISHCVGDASLNGVIEGALWAHRRMLLRHPSRHSSANNHRVAELGALVVLGGATLTEFEHCLALQVLADGSGSEASIAYLGVCVDWALLVRACTGGSASLSALIRQSGTFLASVVDDSTSLNMGDGDGDGLLGTDRSVAEIAASALGIGGHLADRMLGTQSRGSLPRTSGFSEDGGIVTHRTSRATVWHLMGPLGLAPLAAHGHADAHSVCLSVQGRPILVDPGTGRYLGSPGLRRWMRSAGAHNGLRVDGADPVRQRSPFQWDPQANVWAHREVSVEEGWSKGDYRGWKGIRHLREMRVEPGTLTLVDEVTGAGEYRLAFPLHFGVGVVLQAMGPARWRAVWESGHAEISVVDQSLKTEILGGGDDRCRRAPVYGTVVEANTLWAEGVVVLPHRRTVQIRWSTDASSPDRSA